MIRAYDIAYLDDAMASVGAMLDYAVNSCGEPLELFWNRFLASGVASSLSRANPKYLAGMSGVELAHTVADRTGAFLPDAEPFIDMGSPEYWTGWAMAYLAWYLDIDYGSLASGGIGVTDLYKRYPTLHEADLSKTVRFAQGRLAKDNPLKRIRENAGLTQMQLATLSGNSLRSIRGYEQGQRSLGKASTESVLSLCRVLGCRTEDLTLHALGTD